MGTQVGGHRTALSPYWTEGLTHRLFFRVYLVWPGLRLKRGHLGGSGADLEGWGWGYRRAVIGLWALGEP